MGSLTNRLRNSSEADWTPRRVIIAAADRIDALEHHLDCIALAIADEDATAESRIERVAEIIEAAS